MSEVISVLVVSVSALLHAWRWRIVCEIAVRAELDASAARRVWVVAWRASVHTLEQERICVGGEGAAGYTWWRVGERISEVNVSTTLQALPFSIVCVVSTGTNGYAGLAYGVSKLVVAGWTNLHAFASIRLSVENWSNWTNCYAHSFLNVSISWGASCHTTFCGIFSVILSWAHRAIDHTFVSCWIFEIPRRTGSYTFTSSIIRIGRGRCTA